MIKLQVTPVFPANVSGDKFVTVIKEAGNWTVSVDYSVLTPGPIHSSATSYVAVQDRDDGIYRAVSLNSLFTSTLDADLQVIGALTGNGILSRTADGAWALRTLQAPAAGITITNPGGIAGDETFALANDLAAVEALSSTGIAVRTGADAWAQRSVVAGFAMTVTNGDGVSGNMSVALTDPELVALAGLVSASDQLPYFTGSGTASLATFTAFARTLLDDTTQGAMQTTLGLVPGTNVQAYDTDLAALAANSGTGLWAVTGSGAGAVRTITAPAAGITVSNGGGVAGNPTLALADDLAAVEGLTTTGIVRRTGTSTWSAGTAVANSELANSSITIAGALTSLGGSISASAILDNISSTQGSVLYRNASAWVVLPPGTAGQFFTTQGTGANPNWSSGGAGTGTVTSVGTAGLATGGPISSSGTVTVPAASDSDAKTGTDTTKALTSSNLAATLGRGASASRSTTQSIATGTATTIAWDTEDYDTDSIHDLVTNNSRLTVPAGVTKIRLFAQTDWTSGAGSYRIAKILKNGGAIAISYKTPIFESFDTLSSGLIVVTAGDYFELSVQHDTGSALNFNQSGIARLKMEIVK